MTYHHGQWKAPEYSAWMAMVHRCTNPKRSDYQNYGGRGIRIAAEWLGPDGYLRFVEHVGPRPSGTSIDRIDVNGNYESGNVRWATRSEQQRNTRRSRWLTLDGETKTLAEWCERTGLGHRTIMLRLKRGWSVEKALRTPSQRALLAAWSES
jgi:hypothetical protein